MSKIIPFGYANGGTVELERLMSLPDTFLVDIRLSARSTWTAFNYSSLQARFSKRYVHMQELGNRNYRYPHKGIKISDPETGIARLIKGLSQGYTLILMCGCREYETCHRRTIVELLKQSLPDVQVKMPDLISLPNMIKCLSIQQPWIWLIASGYKDVENRPWTTAYRGPVLLHAGAKIDREWFTTDGQLEDHPMSDLAPSTMPDMAYYPIKSIVGVAHLVDVATEHHSPWFRGPYGFVFENAQMFGNPIPYSGSLKLFDVPCEAIPEWEPLQGRR